MRAVTADTTLFASFISFLREWKEEERRLWFDLINSFFFWNAFCLPILLSIWIISCTNTLEREKKRRETVGLNGFPSQSFSGRKKKKKLCAHVMCVHTSVCFFLFSRVVRDAPATGNIPIVSFPPTKKKSAFDFFFFKFQIEKSWERPWFNPAVTRRRFTRPICQSCLKFFKTRALR